MADKDQVNQLLAEAAEKVQEATEIAMCSKGFQAVTHTDILKEMGRIPCLLRELIIENS